MSVPFDALVAVAREFIRSEGDRDVGISEVLEELSHKFGDRLPTRPDAFTRAINAWLKSENHFRRFQADREAGERADGKRDGQVYDAPVSPLSSTTTSWGHGE
jgi:hypothetical protein